MTNLPLVSVIAVCYNQAQYLVETLDSIKNQTYSNIELLIMDDCSTDNSVDVIENWIERNNYDCKFIAHKANLGLCPTLNEALSHINGVYYQVLACDDLIFPNKYELQVNAFLEEDENCAVVFSDTVFIDDNGKDLYGYFIQRNRPRIFKVPSGNIYQELMHSNFIPANSVLIKKELVTNIGGYDEKITYEDFDMWLRLSKNYKFIFLDKITCKYRIHNKNMHITANFKSQDLINAFYIYSKHIQEDFALKKIKSIIDKLYELGIYKNYKKDILALGINTKVMFFIKKEISYKFYSRISKVKQFFKFK